MRADTVNQWYNEFLRCKTQGSHEAAVLILIALTDGQDRALDLVNLANALTAWRMLPTTSHEDKPWYEPLPSASTFLNLVPPPADNSK